MSLLLRRRAAADVVVPPVTPPPDVSGGFFSAYDRLHAARRKRDRELWLAEQEAQQLQDELDREIAMLLRKQEAEDAERLELQRLSDLVKKYADLAASEAASDRVIKALARANATQSAAALVALQREIDRQLDEEEAAFLLIFNQ